MKKKNRKPLLNSQVSGFFIPVKFRMNQRHNKSPGKPKIYTRGEIDRYQEELENGKAQTPRKNDDNLAKHCGPNYRRFSDYELSKFMPPKLKGKKWGDETPDGESVDSDPAQDEVPVEVDYDDGDVDNTEAKDRDEIRQMPAHGIRILRI